MKRILTEPIKVFASGTNFFALGFYYPDGKVELLRGSIISPYATNSTRERIVSLRNEIIRKAKGECTLVSDVTFENPSEAASVLSGNMRNGYDLFRTTDTIPLGEYLEVEGFDQSQQEEATPPVFHEGKSVEAVLNRYERNREAREACIEYYGAKCAICGFDFEKMYGGDFKGIIQVHHIVPVSEVGEEYAVDPIKDLIPVCPNCHVALHSKKGGVYTPDELRSIIRKAKE